MDITQRKLEIGDVYGLYDFKRKGDCTNCPAENVPVNKVSHCAECQATLDVNAGVFD